MGVVPPEVGERVIPMNGLMNEIVQILGVARSEESRGSMCDRETRDCGNAGRQEVAT
jgi:hypothetical protein